LLSDADMFLPELKISLTVTPNQKIRRGNTISELKFPREMRNLFEAELKGNRFYHPNFLQHLARADQPLLVQPILRAASKAGVRITP